MKLAFCLFKYFPFGGLQRDFLRIAQTCQSRGHSIEVFTMSWEGEIPSGFDVAVVPTQGYSNHRRCESFGRAVTDRLAKGRFDAVVGFNRMPGLDVYFAADPCYKARIEETRGRLYRLGARYRTYAAMEKAVFAGRSGTEILLISEAEKPNFIKHYGTPEERLHSLPPGIAKDRIAPGNAGEIRAEKRGELGVVEDEHMLLMVGSGFKTKGLDRSIAALAALPEALRAKTKLFVIGQGKAAPFEKSARRLGVGDRLHLLGGRTDVPAFLLAADLLLHPAYTENTGTVLVEALASGLPVLASDVCGYGFHIERAGAGKLIPSPFEPSRFADLLQAMLNSDEKEEWRSNALRYAAGTDLYSLPERAAEIIESVHRRGERH